jgi:uncharacterized membrane protein YeiH
MELIILDIIGIIAFAISGYIISSKADYDLLGILLISSISALGGGLTRDMILGVTPFVFSATYPLVVVIAVIVFAFLLKYHHSESLEENRLFVIADTIGLSVFAYTGATAAITAGFNIGGVIFLGLFTAIGGGMIRDIIMNKEIYTLRKGFYGTVAMLVALLTFFVNLYIGVSIIGTFLIILFGVCIRFIAIKYNWELPRLK